MNPKHKLILFFLVITIAVLSNYIMKHSIVQYAQENAVLERELLSERAINKDLTSEYNHLQAYSRIVTIAKNELGMIIPANNPAMIQVVHNSNIRNRTVSRFIDFITPSAEAASF